MAPELLGVSRRRSTIGIAAASAGLVIFACCSHQPLPWSAPGAAGLLLAASAIGWTPFGAAGPASVLGVQTFPRRAVFLSVLGVVIGSAAGLWHRRELGLPLLPGSPVQTFVIVACLIGATEELIYRGWLLGLARSFGSPAAVTMAALAHAAYKTALFAWPPIPSPVDLAGLALATAAGGLVLGWLRVSSSSLIPPMLAHVAFDFVVYRSVAQAPWWVWN